MCIGAILFMEQRLMRVKHEAERQKTLPTLNTDPSDPFIVGIRVLQVMRCGVYALALVKLSSCLYV